MFRGTVNPTTGRLEWVEQDRDVTSEECDISPELARWRDWSSLAWPHPVATQDYDWSVHAHQFLNTV